MDVGTADDYAERMLAGDKFPPVTVFNDGKSFFLADGFHRVAACIKNEYAEISADVRDGTQMDALRFALGANRTNGLARSNADKRRCVLLALEHFGNMSERAIAEMVGVSHMMVFRIRGEESQQANCNIVTVDDSTRVGRDGIQRPSTMTQRSAPPNQAPQTECQSHPERPIAAKSDNQWLASLKAIWRQTPRDSRAAFLAWELDYRAIEQTQDQVNGEIDQKRQSKVNAKPSPS